jgi:hypothetical protein
VGVVSILSSVSGRFVTLRGVFQASFVNGELKYPKFGKVQKEETLNCANEYLVFFLQDT